MKRLTISIAAILLVFSVRGFSQDKIEKEINTLVNKLKAIENTNEHNSIQKRSAILNGRSAPYALLFEHTGLFEWQLFSECFYDWDIDTTTVVDVDVDYKPNDDLFSTIPAYFIFNSKRPYDLEDYKTLMINVFKALGSSVTVLHDEASTKYGYTGHHYCQSFTYSTTRMLIDSYFIQVDDISCLVYYMTGESFYNNFLYQIFFDLILDVLEFKSASNAQSKSISKPVNFQLNQNYPNPFNNETVIEYSINKPSKIKLEIFDIAGKKVQTLVDDYQNVGNYKIGFDASTLSSGVYVYRILNNEGYRAHQMLLIK